MNHPSPPLDLTDYRARNERIARARAAAREDFVKYGLEEADAEHEYRKRKAASFAANRKDKGVNESEILAEGTVAEWRQKRDTAHILRRASELRIAELEGNRAMLRADADWSQRVDPLGSAA